MATTKVQITSAPGGRFPLPTEVPIVAGDAVEFAADADTTLFLSAEALTLLSPQSSLLQVSIPAGGSVTYSFRGAASGVCRVQVAPSGTAAPATMTGTPKSSGPVLLVLGFGTPSFSGPGLDVDR